MDRDIFKSSVDEMGRVTYVYQGKRKFLPATESILGSSVRLITDLNVSESLNLKTPDGRRYKKLKTRIYSLHDIKKKCLVGHATRFVVKDVDVDINHKLRLKVFKERSKTPHAFLTGELIEIVSNDDYMRHFSIMRDMVSAGAVHIAYDPYKAETFCVTGTQKSMCNNEDIIATLPRVETIRQKSLLPKIYCFEDGILAIPSSLMNAKGLGQMDMFSDSVNILLAR